MHISLGPPMCACELSSLPQGPPSPTFSCSHLAPRGKIPVKSPIRDRSQAGSQHARLHAAFHTPIHAQSRLAVPRSCGTAVPPQTIAGWCKLLPAVDGHSRPAQGAAHGGDGRYQERNDACHQPAGSVLPLHDGKRCLLRQHFVAISVSAKVADKPCTYQFGRRVPFQKSR